MVLGEVLGLDQENLGSYPSSAMKFITHTHRHTTIFNLTLEDCPEATLETYTPRHTIQST